MASPKGRRKARPASLDPQELLEAAYAGSTPPVILVTGQDYFSREALLQALRRELLSGGFEAFNEAALSGEEVSGPDLVDQAEMLPMGAGHRLIRVRRAEKMRERELEAIAAYAEAPCPSTCLIFVFDEAKGSILVGLKKVAPLLDLPAPRDYQLARWLETQARRMKISLDADAARALAALAGEDYIAAMSELEKAALNVKSARITRKMIQDLAARGQDTNPFHLADAVLGNEPARAVKILRDLHGAGVTGYVILGMLESQLRRFLTMRARVAKGEPARSVIQSTSPTLPPEVKARLTRQLESFDEPRLIDAFRAARRTDRAIKGHGSGAELAHMEALVWEICAS